MQKEKVMIYPFDVEYCPVIRHKSLLKDYKPVELVSLKGWGFAGKDAGVVDGGGTTEIIVKDDYVKSLEHCDTVIFCDSQYYPGIENDIYLRMKEAVLNKKNVVSLVSLEDKLQNELVELSKTNNTYVDFLSIAKDKTDRHLSRRDTFKKGELEYRSSANVYETILKIDTPVVFVMGITERTSKFEIQLSLREKLLKMGYKISQIGSRSYCEHLGFHSFPDFMQCNSLSEVDKIVNFNRYIKDIEEEEKPDIIIIGIPGGTMKINDKYTNRFGVYAYEISQAVEPDYVIMSTFYQDFKPEYFDKINILSKYRYGCEVDCFNIANVQLDWGEADRLGSDLHIKLNNGFISKKTEQYLNLGMPVYNIFNSEHVDRIVSGMVDKLSDYAETEII